MSRKIRRLVRDAAESALGLLGGTARFVHAHRGRIAILAYHNVVADRYPERGDRSLHLRLTDFLRQLDFLVRHYDVVPLTGIEAPGGDRPRAAITFDDGYRGVFDLALPALAERHLPSTIFLCPGHLGGRGFWWDMLADLESGLDPSVRERALSEMSGQHDRIRASGLELRDVPPLMQPATLDEVRQGLDPLVSLGSHSWTHPVLTAIPQPQLARELESTRDWLRAEFPEHSLLDHLSYPYGIGSEATAKAAERAGYKRLYLVHGGPAEVGDMSTTGVTTLPRINVPAGVSLRGFEIRLAGLR